ncbi:transcriptional regulatory protein degu [Marinomonas sp. MED121]|uniref:response regulator transcription factor n=1 Tax=Marinomonas sp. MED121 TaxID=314277 RepID=UPI000068FD19|nr:response regulator transcription factor [Marinomonas sp. MED121]EAQ63746.1 transcriptional regulatory protein degu [Marinomonas sp. MED121]
MQTIKVLLVDDHMLVLDGLKARLELEDNIKVIGIANNGIEALEQSKKLDPDVVLMDVSMPVLNGIEAAKRFQTEQPDKKVLMLSMHQDKEYILSIIQTGASGYVLKDVPAAELVLAIETVIRGGSYFSSGASQALYQVQEDEKEELTKRELAVLKELASGAANKTIANNLSISVRTVETHRQNLKQKLGIHSAAGLTKYAIEHKLI